MLSWAFPRPALVVEQTIISMDYLNITADTLHIYIVCVFRQGNGISEEDKSCRQKAQIVLGWFQKHNTECQLKFYHITQRIII